MAGTLMLVNPKKRTTHKRRKHNPAKKTAKRATSHKRRHNPIVAHHTRRRVKRRRNPVSQGAIMHDLKGAFAGAVGALGVDVVMGYVKDKLPVSLQTGTMGTIAKLGLSVGLGVVLHKTKIGGRQFAADAVRGAMTVSIHEALRSTVASAVPTLKLGDIYDNAGVGEYIPTNGIGEYIPTNGIGEYVPTAGRIADSMQGMGDIYADAMGDALFPSPYDQ